MSNASETILMYLVIYGSAAVWGGIGIITYKPKQFRGWLAHSAVFLLISALTALVAAKICFAPVDDSYSYSNVSALGLLYLYWLLIFAIACFVVIFGNLGKYCSKNGKNSQPEQEEKPEK